MDVHVKILAAFHIVLGLLGLTAAFAILPGSSSACSD